MLNLTLLSFTIASSFQKSPFIHLPSTTKPSFSVFKKISAKYFFSSFFVTQSYDSFSIIEESTFNRFITSYSILSFNSKELETTIKNQTFYGDTIPSKNNIFYRTKYTKIINCKFMSIIDDNNNNEQWILDGGLCIYTRQSTIIESCYFFAILSHRSGSCILFDEDEMTESKVIYSMFKSITQHPLAQYITYFSGGVISHGTPIENEYGFDVIPVYSSITGNCCFDNIKLIESASHSVQLGIVTYISPFILCQNLNFTDNKMTGYVNLYGMITYVCIQPMENSFSFINIFNCEYCQIGTFSLLMMTRYNLMLFMSYTNFINNSKKDNNAFPQFGIEVVHLNETFLLFENIQCNSKEPFIGLPYGESDESNPISIFVFNSLFGCSFSSFISDEDQIIFEELSTDNIFDHSDFIADITNDIISNFGYIQTSQFSASNIFSNKFIQTSDFDFVVNTELPTTAIIVVASILGVIAVLFFFAILCCREKIGKIYIDQFDQLDFDNEIENISS